MKEGRYTAREIEDMRTSVRELMSVGYFLSPSPDASQVELRLLTHMKNGTRPKELRDMAVEKRKRDAAAASSRAERYKKEGRDPLGRRRSAP